MKRDVRWKPSLGFVIFVWMLVALALIWEFGFFTVKSTGQTSRYFWHETLVYITKGTGVYYYNFAPIIIGFVACFLPLLVFPIGKRMKNAQAILLFVLAFEMFMVFAGVYCLGLQIDSMEMIVKWMGEDLFIVSGTQILYIHVPVFSRLFVGIILCLTPFLAFPIASSVCRRKGYQPMITTLLFVISFLAIALLTLGWYTSHEKLYWYTILIADEKFVNQGGLFGIIVGYFVAVIPMLFLGKKKEHKEEKVEKEYSQIFYVPIERK